jgi:hypothetical protein
MEPCAGADCTVFGSPATAGLCSSCHRNSRGAAVGDTSKIPLLAAARADISESTQSLEVARARLDALEMAASPAEFTC